MTMGINADISKVDTYVCTSIVGREHELSDLKFINRKMFFSYDTVLNMTLKVTLKF